MAYFPIIFSLTVLWPPFAWSSFSSAVPPGCSSGSNPRSSGNRYWSRPTTQPESCRPG